MAAFVNAGTGAAKQDADRVSGASDRQTEPALDARFRHQEGRPLTKLL
jgi:hypothetical protein